MIRSLVVAALLASAASAQPAVPSTALYADVIGPIGAYALGIERAISLSVDGERQLRVRAGAASWTETPLGSGVTDRVIAVPVGAAALFSLGRPAGVPTAFEVGGGAVFVRRSGPRFGTVGEDFALPVYAEAAVRAALSGRVGLRAGVVTGGAAAGWISGQLTDVRARPTVGLGVGL